jgi:hypothetical protein
MRLTHWLRLHSPRRAPIAATSHIMDFSAHIVRVCFFVVEVGSPFTAASYRVTASSPATLYVIRHIVHCGLHPTPAPFARPSYVLKYLTAGAGSVPSPPHSVLSHLRYISPSTAVRTAQSLLPHTHTLTHSHTVYVYIYPTQPIPLALAAVDLIRRQTASASPHRTYVCDSGVRAIDVRVPPQALTWSSGLRNHSSLGFHVVKHDRSPW